MSAVKSPPIDSNESKAPALGRFRSLAFLGEGGFGRVWKVRDPLRPERDLALKVLDDVSTPDAVRGRVDAPGHSGSNPLAREFRIGARLNHPVILESIETGYLDAGERRRPYLLSEFVEGEPLEPPWSRAELETVALELLSALDTIHRAGWRHGDIQPRNILVNRAPGDSHPRLLDFGLAQELGETSGTPRTSGVPRYMAPETLGGLPADHRADLYALGLVLYECLNGKIQTPLGDHLVATRQRVFYGEIERAALPAPFGTLLRGLLEPDPQARIQSAREAADIILRESSGEHGPGLWSGGPSFESHAPIGRDEFLEALSRALARYERRRVTRLRLILIDGEEGLGKSRMIQESVLSTTAHGRLGALTWSDCRRRATAQLRREAKGSAHPRSSKTGLEPQAVSDSSELNARDQLAEAVLSQLSREPTLLAVDDFDELSLDDQEVLRALVEKAWSWSEDRDRLPPKSTLPLVVFSCRPGGVTGRGAEIWERFRELPVSESFRLDPWTRDEEDAYLDRVLVPERALADSVDLLRQEARGQPARWRWLLETLSSQGQLRLDGGVWKCDTRALGEGLAVPGARARFVEAWERLPSTARDLLVALALHIDRDTVVTVDTAAQILQERESRVRYAFSQIRSLSVFEDVEDPLRTLWGKESLRTGLNRRTRAWIQRQVGPQTRLRFRERLASKAAREEERVFHAIRLGPVQASRVREVGKAGGRLAQRVLSEHASSPHSSVSERVRSALLLGESLEREGRLKPARRALERVLSDATQPALRAHAALLLGEVESASGHHENAERYFARAAGRIAVADDDAPRLLYSRAVDRIRAGREDEAEPLVIDGVKRYKNIPGFHTLSGTLSLRAGEIPEARDLFARASKVARKHGNPMQKADAATNHARALLRLGDLNAAVTELRSAVEAFDQAGARAQVALALGNLGVVLRRQGDYDAAGSALQRSLDIYREVDDSAGMSIVQASLAILARELGLPGTAGRRFEAARTTASRAGEAALRRLEESPVFIENQALLFLALGEPARALALREQLGKPQERGDSSADSRLLDASLVSEGQLAPDPGLFPSAPLVDADVAWLFEVAMAKGDAEKSKALAQVKKKARAALKELAGSSPHAALLHDLERLENSPRSSRATSAPAALLDGLERLPLRSIRLRGLAMLLARAKESDVKKRAAALLKTLLDELFTDLLPEHRARFRARPDIQEMMKHMQAHELGKPDIDGSSQILLEVFRFTRQLLIEDNADALLANIVDTAMAITGAERGFLAVRGKGGMRLRVGRSHGENLSDPESELSHTILERTLSEGTARITTDAREDLSLRSVASVEDLGLRSIICVPLLGKRRRALGALYLDNPLEKGVFGAEHLELVENFCVQAVLAWTQAEKRLERERLVEELKEAKKRLEEDLDQTRREARRRKSSEERAFSGIIADDRKMRELFHFVEVVGPTDIPVLITGESGVGKEMFVRALHENSGRREQALVAENCGAVPAGLLESVLFGHVKGAFTGADRNRRGLFELAHGGTLFLDEIAELPLELQTRLLRVLQEREVRPLGSQRIVQVDVRIIAATNRNLSDEIARGRFREDLYYRLQGAELLVPPLRERRGDIGLLAEHFLKKYSDDETQPKQLGSETIERLMRYDWPGNVRELENEIRRAVVMAPKRQIGVEYLSAQVREGRRIASAASVSSGGPEPVRPLRVVERDSILNAMTQLDGHRGKVAEALGISRTNLYHKLKEMNYDRSE